MDARHLIQPGQQVCLRDQYEERRRLGRGLGQPDRGQANQGWQGAERDRRQLSEHLQKTVGAGLCACPCAWATTQGCPYINHHHRPGTTVPSTTARFAPVTWGRLHGTPLTYW